MALTIGLPSLKKEPGGDKSMAVKNEYLQEAPIRYMRLIQIGLSESSALDARNMTGR